MAVETKKATKSKIAADFGVPLNTLSTWLKKADEIKKTYHSGDFGPQRKRNRTVQFPEVEEAVLKRFKMARDSCIPISGPLLMQKAVQFARDLGVSDGDLSFSTGWLEKFKDRHGIVFKKVCGEAKSVDSDSDSMREWSERLQTILSQFSPENIFNADETGLFYRLHSDKTLEFKGVDCHGGKQSKERLTVMVCANMTGSEKIKLFVIGKSKKPRCFKNVKTLPTDYTANKKAWMTSELFTEWLTKFDKKIYCQKRKVVLVIDDCPAHPNVPGLKAVTLVFLPPNTTSVTQPMDQGVIQWLKTHYRKLVLMKQVKCVDDKTEFHLSVLDALRLLQQSWANVKPETIANCFRHARFIQKSDDPTPPPIPDDDNPDDDIPLIYLCSGVTLQQFASIDDNVPTHEQITEQNIVDAIIQQRQQGNQHSDIEEEEQETDTPTPSVQTTVSAIDIIRSFVESQDSVPDSVFSAVAHISNFVNKCDLSRKMYVQKSLPDMFLLEKRDL